MTRLKSLPSYSVTVRSAGRRAHWKSTTSKVAPHESTSEKTLSDSVASATTGYTQCRGKAACRKGKCSQQRCSSTQSISVRRRWPAYVTVMVLATALSACRLGHWIGDSAIQLLLYGRIR